MNRLFEISNLSTPSRFSVGERFQISDETPSSFNILRLSSGFVKITNLDTSYSIDIRENFLSDFYSFDDGLSFEDNLCKILNESIEPSDLEVFFFDRRYMLKNRDFFKRLENEFCNFLTYNAKGSYTTAFVFIYRILEVISFSFPLIYAAKTYDFKDTFAKLKEVFDSNSGNSKGELGFLKSAIKVMFTDRDFMETSIDIILDDEYERNSKIFKTIRNIVTESNVFHGDTIENSKISIRFGEVSSFIVTIRNKFFHLFNRGDRNLESIEMIDPDYFFSKLNKPLFGWICVVYIEIIKFLLEEHEKYIR